MRPISVSDMVEVDRLMVDEYGITLLQMMENAGRSLAATARREHRGTAGARPRGQGQQRRRRPCGG